MPRVLFLGGSHQQLAPILYAKAMGYHTIVCDYTPENPAIGLADEWHSASTTDIEAILKVSRDSKIDGIVAYASDPAAYTAALVAEKLGLPGNPPASVEILSKKDLYRNFLYKNGFNTPGVLFGDSPNLEYPVVIKPTDSSGSRGITVLRNQVGFTDAVKRANVFSRSGDIIIEKYIERDGYQIAGDGFLVDGKLVRACFANEHFDPDGGIVPIGESFPYIGNMETQSKVRSEIQRLIDALGMKNGALNFDIVISNDKIYLMEIGPRNGGCLIPEVIKYSTGVDMISATVECAIGNRIIFPKSERRGFYSSYMIHSQYPGKFKSLDTDDSINIVEANLWVNAGDEIKSYENSSCTLGTMILKFDNQLEMLERMNRMRDYVRAVVE